MASVIPLRLYAYGAAALAVVALIATAHIQTKRLNAAKSELATAKATILAERENTRKANESAQRYASRLSLSRGPRSPPARIMCQLPRVPEAPAASGTDDAAAPDDAGVHEAVDIGPRIDVPFRACEENWIKLQELQRWVRDR